MFVFLGLGYFTQNESLKFHPFACKIHVFVFNSWIEFHCVDVSHFLMALAFPCVVPVFLSSCGSEPLLAIFRLRILSDYAVLHCLGSHSGESVPNPLSFALSLQGHSVSRHTSIHLLTLSSVQRSHKCKYHPFDLGWQLWVMLEYYPV